MSKYLGDISAYALAVSQGYAGTEEEYAELMASYATVGQTAVTAAQTATTKASEAATSATTATNKASEATTAAQTATTKAGEASTSASQASASAQTASTKASEASQSASTATEKATEATTAAATATTAKNDAETAKNAAETAQGKAETAQEAAEDAAESVSASAAQIQTNKEDITELKSAFANYTDSTNAKIGDVKSVSTEEQITIGQSTNGLLSGVVGNAISIDTTSSSKQYFVYVAVGIDPLTEYKLTTRINIGFTAYPYFAFECDSNDVVLACHAALEGHTSGLYTEQFRSCASASKLYIMSYIRWETADGIALTEIENVYDPIATDLYNTMDAVSTIDGLFVRVKSDNLFDKTAVTAEGTTNVWWSDYIPIQVGNSYAWYSTYHRNIYFYTESKELITDKLGDNQDGVHVYAVDVTGAKYARFKLVTANLDTAMFVKGSAYPSTYERYVDGYTFSSEVVPSEMINPLFGKKLAINGDSIMYGAAYAGGFAKMIADTNGMNFENDAVSGGCLTSGQSTSGGTPAHCISTSVNAMADDADYILFDGGINDYWHNAPLGTYSDDMSVTGDTTTIYGALDTLFQSALTKWSAGQKIVFVITHKIGATWRTANGAGLTFGDYHAAIVKMCNKYSIPVCDIYSISQFNTEMPYYYTNYTSNDGTHPNENGYKYFYKTQVQNFLKTL